jgi:hypothetical protein
MLADFAAEIIPQIEAEIGQGKRTDLLRGNPPEVKSTHPGRHAFMEATGASVEEAKMIKSIHDLALQFPIFAIVLAFYAFDDAIDYNLLERESFLPGFSLHKTQLVWRQFENQSIGIVLDLETDEHADSKSVLGVIRPRAPAWPARRQVVPDVGRQRA